MLFTIVSLPDGYLFYKHLLRYVGIGSRPVTSMLHLVRVKCTAGLFGHTGSQSKAQVFLSIYVCKQLDNLLQ